MLLFCGAGGAAQATAVYLSGCGVREISFINRTVSKAEALAGACVKHNSGLTAEYCEPDDEKKCVELLGRADFLIQATSLGLKADDPLPLPEKYFHSGMNIKIFDTIYHSTSIQILAEKLNLKWADGREMLIRQGAASFEMWTGLKPDLEAMRYGFEQGVPGDEY